MLRYTFGNDAPAVQRLALVAEAYERTSRTFLESLAPVGSRTAVDAGCGPGFSTALLRDVCRADLVIGVDASPELLAVASGCVPDGVFVEADVSEGRVPGAPADVIYARLVLAHLPDPIQTAEAWRSSLAPGGVLLIEDLEGVEAQDGPLQDYEDISGRVVAAGGGVFYGGARLRHLGGDVVTVTVPASRAAAIYLFNVERWLQSRPAGVDGEDLTRLQAGLREIAVSKPPGSVSWLVRQLPMWSVQDARHHE